MRAYANPSPSHLLSLQKAQDSLRPTTTSRTALSLFLALWVCSTTSANRRRPSDKRRCSHSLVRRRSLGRIPASSSSLGGSSLLADSECRQAAAWKAAASSSSRGDHQSSTAGFRERGQRFYSGCVVTFSICLNPPHLLTHKILSLLAPPFGRKLNYKAKLSQRHLSTEN